MRSRLHLRLVRFALEIGVQWYSFTILEEDDVHGCGLTNLSARRHSFTISGEDDAHGCGGLAMISRFIEPFLYTTTLIHHLGRR
jgi:hypothetical protein